MLCRRGFVISLLLSLGALPTRADVLVDVTLSSLSPNPVNIVTGETVFWTDADGNGPYNIYANNSAWSTVTDGSGIRFLQAGTYGYFDDNGDGGTIKVADNIPPSVTITNPANQAIFSAPASFSFATMASDTDPDGLSDVEFYVGPKLIDDVFSPPFATSVSGLVAGRYTLTAIAYDRAGAKATNSISITVGTVAPAPALVAKQSGNQVLITWTTNNAAGLSLQSTTNLSPSASWTPVAAPTTIIGSQLVVTNPIVGARQFFRLSDH